MLNPESPGPSLAPSKQTTANPFGQTEYGFDDDQGQGNN
jgi:hypothetical protein